MSVDLVDGTIFTQFYQNHYQLLFCSEQVARQSPILNINVIIRESSKWPS